MRVGLRACGALAFFSCCSDVAACSTFSGESPVPLNDATADSPDLDAGRADGDGDAGGSLDEGCVPGLLVTPKRVDVESFGGGIGTYVCLGSALDGGGAAVAVIAPGLNYDILPGRRVTGCIRADFGRDLPLERVELVARTVPAASECSLATTDPSQPSTGVDLYVSSAESPAAGDYVAIGLATVNSISAPIGAPVKTPMRHLLVCRTNQPAGLLAIESVRGLCR